MKIQQYFLELQLKMSGMFFWDTLCNCILSSGIMRYKFEAIIITYTLIFYQEC